MKKSIITLTLLFISIFIFAQNEVVVLNKSLEIKNDVFHFRANKGDNLYINITTELQNEKKAKYYELKNVKIYRQQASDEFQYIIDKNDVTKIDINLFVPSNGVYTIEINRGGLTKFNTNLFVQRTPAHDSLKNIKHQAFLVDIPDTVHNYYRDSVIYDNVRTATPYTKKQRTPQYKEDQIFLDISYALRFGGEYAIPIVMPYEIMTDYKIAKSIKWGFYLTVSDAVYKALQKKVGEIATEAISAGAGKAMSGKVNPATGEVVETTLTKGYKVFEYASTVNAIAEITGDAGEVSNKKSVEVGSDVVKTVTGFTSLTETAGKAIGNLMPRIEDEIIWKVVTQQEYQKYLRKEPYSVMKEGHGCYADGVFDIKSANQIYYIIIKNERNAEGGVLKTLEGLGKTILCQYVYTNLKVFVQRKVEVTYDRGYYENTYQPVYNRTWKTSETKTSTQKVIYENEIKPYYKKLNSTNIY
jgi:hypothetical protein